MSQDSIGAVTTGQGKLQEWKTTQKQNLSRKSRGTLTVKWAGSRDKIFSPGRGRTFFLTSLFIELIEALFGLFPRSMSDNAWLQQCPPRHRSIILTPCGPASCTSNRKRRV